MFLVHEKSCSGLSSGVRDEVSEETVSLLLIYKLPLKKMNPAFHALTSIWTGKLTFDMTTTTCPLVSVITPYWTGASSPK